MASFALQVLTPERALVDGPAQALVLRTVEGDMTVLDGHTSLVASVVPGDVRVDHEDGSSLHLAVHGAFLQVDTSAGAAGEQAGEQAGASGEGPLKGLSTRVTLLAGIAELTDEIDVVRAQRAKEEAESRLSSSGPTSEDPSPERDEAAASLQRAELRLRVAGGAAS